MSRNTGQSIVVGGSSVRGRLQTSDEVVEAWPEEPPEARRTTSRKYGILIVDDDATVRDLLNVWMQQEGFAVWLAANGREALDLYRRHREAIDVALLDVRMANPDGPQTLAGLQELNPQIRSCFMSGGFGNYTEERLLTLGATTVFPKPFHLAEVVQVLWELAKKAYLSRSRG